MSSRTVENSQAWYQSAAIVTPQMDDDVAAINSLILDKFNDGGGIVWIPNKTFIVGDSGGNTALRLRTGVWLKGMGPLSTLKLKDGADAHLINVFEGTENCGIFGLTLDGNRAAQTLTVHGVRIGGVDGLTVSDCTIKNAFHYGIGIQAGTSKGVKINNVRIQDTGGDGIDIKNKNQNNEDIQLSNISVKRFGKNPALTVQVGIDCRGAVTATNIWISEPVADDAVGYRFRNGELDEVNGFGGHRSTLTGFQIRMGNGSVQIGLNAPARDIALGQGYISGGFRGVIAQDSGFSATGVTVEGASEDGWVIDAAGSGLDADTAALTGCKAIGCGSDGFVIETASVDLIACKATGNANAGLRVQASATNTRVIGGDYSGNTLASIADGGTGTVVRNAIGYKTEAQLESGSLTLDSTGSKTATIPHGLAKAPTLKQCIPHLIRETNVTDAVISNLWVEAVDATNVTVRARVATATATVGATFRIGVNIRM